MEFTAYGGAGEIGGNKLVIKINKTKVLFDFGTPFVVGGEFYSGFDFLNPRKKLGLRDYFEFDIMPRIEGLYSKEALQYTDMPYKKPEFEAVFISHIHADHMGDVVYIDPNIPMYLGYGAKKLNDTYNIMYPGFKNEDNGNVREFKTGDEIKLKDMTVIPIHVDHSTLGAYGFVIKTAEGTIAYTGDYRFHGFRGDMTEDFMKRANKEKVKTLITEGTRVNSALDKIYRKNLTEADVENDLYKAIIKSKGITFANFPFRNMDRVRSLYNATKKANKILVASPGLFYAVDNAGILVKDLPTTKNNPNMKVYNKNSDLPDDEKKTLSFSKPYLEKAVNYKWVKENQKDVVMFMAESEFSQMIDIQPKAGSFIYSTSEHYLDGEGYEDKKQSLTNWLNHFHLEFEQIHCSGHADKVGVKRMIDGVAPNKVIPVHTEDPKAFGELHKNVAIPEKGKTIII
ncbi:MAG: MBL fold metallo-hydrolase [bacterium]